MSLQPKRLAIALLIALFCLESRQSVVYAGTIEVLIDSLSSVTPTGGLIRSSKAPSLNDAGTIGMIGFSEGFSWLATYSKSDSLSILLTTSDSAVFNDRVSLRFSSLTGQRIALSNSGHSAALVVVRGRSIEEGIFVHRTGTPSSQVAIREGSYELITSETVDFSSLPRRVPSLNNNGEIGFIANRGHAIYKQGDDLQEIMRVGDTAPHNGGVILGLTPPSISDSGRVAYLASVDNPDGTQGGTLYSFDGTDYFEIASSGQVVPGGNGHFSFEGSLDDGIHGFDFPGVNDADQLGFAARITGTNRGRDEYGIYLGDESGLIELARTGDVSSKGSVINGAERSRAFRMGSRGVSNSGKVLFHSTFDGLSYGYFVADSVSGSLVEIARSGQALEKGGSLGLSIFGSTFNDSGEVAILGSGGGRSAIFFVESDGTLNEVIRVGDSFQGSTITQLNFSTQINETGDETSGFNNLGQIAFQYALENGVSGIALYTPVPEPSAISIALILIVGSSIQRRRVRL